MSNVLNEICARKQEHIAERKSAVSLEQLQEQIHAAPAPKGFVNAMQAAPFPAMITEVKKASPSKGVIREDFDPVEIAKIYKDHGATCLSVLTDEPYFQGKDEYFVDIRSAVDLPMLRKDFMLDPYQIYESRSLGADCILIIMAALSDAQASDLHALSKELGMDVLVEVHDSDELERALALNPEMLGVNNRNLKTLTVDVQTSYALAKNIPDTCFKISESGISDPATIQDLKSAGYTGFLIGESLMRQDDIGAALQNLRSA